MNSIKKLYDFILFENQEGNINHYKDINIIAKYLVSAGYTVAIADVFAESEYCREPGVPHIDIKGHKSIDRTIRRFWNPVAWVHRFKRNQYYKSVIKQIAPLCNNIYAGSYHLTISNSWIKTIPSNVNCFFWGLRSWWLCPSSIPKYTPNWFNAKNNLSVFKSSNNIKFFVSDNSIISEFLSLGFNRDRLVLRPERFCENDDVSITSMSANDELNILSIGSLRSDKRIEVISNVVKRIGSKVHYTIAGASSTEYEHIISSSIGNASNIHRINHRLTDNEFTSLLTNADFLVLCDVKQPSSVTNGTMMEALINGIPIIAPDYDPYKYYIEKYGIGILFDPDEKDSLENAIRRAIEVGRASFQTKILALKGELTYENTVKVFSNDLRKAII